MPTTTIHDTEELERFEYNGALADGALVRDAHGRLWLGYDSEYDGAQCISPHNEDDDVVVSDGQLPAVFRDLSNLPLPLTITTQEN